MLRARVNRNTVLAQLLVLAVPSCPVTAQPTIYGLGSLTGFGNVDFGAYGINSSRQVVGYSPTPNGFYHAFRYDGTPGVNGIMRDLGTMMGSFGESLGYGINDRGDVTGQALINTASIGFALEHHPFLYK